MANYTTYVKPYYDLRTKEDFIFPVTYTNPSNPGKQKGRKRISLKKKNLNFKNPETASISFLYPPQFSNSSLELTS